jgi:hypothetical protein
MQYPDKDAVDTASTRQLEAWLQHLPPPADDRERAVFARVGARRRTRRTRTQAAAADGEVSRDR